VRILVNVLIPSEPGVEDRLLIQHRRYFDEDEHFVADRIALVQRTVVATDMAVRPKPSYVVLKLLPISAVLELADKLNGQELYDYLQHLEEQEVLRAASATQHR
jgi:hypothetical protein